MERINTKEVMNKINTNEKVLDELSIVYSLSFPMLIKMDDIIKLQVFIYLSNLYNDNDLECHGELITDFNNDPKIIFKLRNVKPVSERINPLSLISRSDSKITCREDFEKLQNKLFSSLDNILRFAFKAPAALSIRDRDHVKTYLEIIRSLSSSDLLNVYYTINPDFFDWCCCALY